MKTKLEEKHGPEHDENQEWEFNCIRAAWPHCRLIESEPEKGADNETIKGD